MAPAAGPPTVAEEYELPCGARPLQSGAYVHRPLLALIAAPAEFRAAVGTEPVPPKAAGVPGFAAPLTR